MWNVGGWLKSLPYLARFQVFLIVALTAACSRLPDSTHPGIIAPGSSSTSSTSSSTSTSSGGPTYADFNWPFTTAGNYNYNATQIEFMGGNAQLKTLDLTDDDNDATEGFGAGTHTNTAWNTDHIEITGGVATGIYTSRILDKGSATSTWTSLTAIAPAAYGKQLPDSQAMEAGYAGANADMTSNVLLYHANEASWVAAGDVIDSSSRANHGNPSGGVGTSTTAKFDRAGYCDGVNDRIATPNTADINTGGPYADRTVEVWFRADGDVTTRQMIFEEGGATRGLNIYLFNDEVYVGGWNRDAGQSNWNGTWRKTAVVANQWYHIVLVLANATDTVTAGKFFGYLNGVEFDAANSDGGRLWAHSGGIATCYDEGSYFHDGSVAGSKEFGGWFDELAIYNRALSATEINNNYLRGAYNIQFQARSCALSDCSDGTLVGPSGTSTDFWDEMDNLATNAPPVYDLTLAPIAAARYFQYRVTLTTSDVSITPSLNSVAIGPTGYFAGGAELVNFLTTAYVGFDNTTTFAHTYGGGNVGSVTYQLSKDATNWFYWNGTGWTAASGAAQSNSAADINTNIEFFDEVIGTGNIYYKAFFNSDGTEAVELDAIDLNQYLE